MNRAIALAAVFYLSLATLTFGHAAANWECSRTENKEIWCGRDNQSAESMMAAIFWPLYWSWELQE